MHGRDTTPTAVISTVRGPHVAIQPRVVGRLRLAAPQRGYPKPTWRVILREARLAPVVAEMLRGLRSTLDDDPVEIVTDAAEIEVLLDGPDAIRIDWYRGARRCSGAEFAEPPRPEEVAARKRAARQGQGCVPRAWVWGRLPGALDLGVVEFVSGNWQFGEEAARLAAMLRNRSRPLRVVLGFIRSEATLASGRRILDTRPSLATCQMRGRKAPREPSQQDRRAKRTA